MGVVRLAGMNGLILSIIAMVLAQVGNTQITDKDLDRYIQIKAFEGYTDTTSPDFRQKALLELINEKVLLLEAEKEGITVSREEVDNYYNLIYREYGDSVEFKAFIKKEGLTPDEIKESLAKDLKIFKLLEQKGEIQYELPPNTFVTRPEEIRYRLIKISNPGYWPFYKRWMRTIKAWYVWMQIKLGLPFEEAARKYSDSRTREIGGDMGIAVVEPHNRFIQIIAQNPPGKVSKPFKTPYAYFIFKVEEKLSQIPVKYSDLNYHERRVVLEKMIPERISRYAQSLWPAFEVKINSNK